MKRLDGMDALTRLNQIIATPKFKGTDDPQFVTWRLNCLRAISQIDGEQSSTYRAFDEIDFEGDQFGGMADEPEYKKNFNECFVKSTAILQSVRDAVLT
jgi:hypothetical protein